MRILSDARGLQCSDWRFPLPRRGPKRPARTPPTIGWIDFDQGLGVARPFSFQLPPRKALSSDAQLSSGGASSRGFAVRVCTDLRGSDSRGVSGPQSKDTDSCAGLTFCTTDRSGSVCWHLLHCSDQPMNALTHAHPIQMPQQQRRRPGERGKGGEGWQDATRRQQLAKQGMI